MKSGLIHICVWLVAIFSTVSCGIFLKRNSNESQQDRGSTLAMKHVTTKAWSFWYPVPADREPRYTEADLSEGGTHYKMQDSVADGQQMYLDFIETSCERAQSIHDKALKGLDQRHEIYYSLQKKGVCALLRFHTDDAARAAIDSRLADETARLVGYFAEPL